MTRIALMALRHIYDPNLSAHLPEILTLFRQLANKETALEYLETLLRYFSAAAEHVTRQELTQAANTVLQSQGEDIMPTIAQQWIEEGSLQATRENILDLLNIRFGIAPPDLAEELSEITDMAILRSLLRQTATADSLSAFEQYFSTLPDDE